ncbi:uncharacterized protein STEHIDRAFT_154949 [Stereum hirsutum FP-91666 SS1]|uniref:uncharacterized protein n=1 Tax=Stereum hirsutum (strain FP-91666) TaxID=721885 RepID=UPI000440A7AB|nr:uncharacterized protein STEHIDRAFT_154949 [Stereum hirsutum FP-91666 SS1]EIM89271.1 hypothetical protein STEHIDRAFT_154949 [Stereum hirsutum FP-91666 SS1]
MSSEIELGSVSQGGDITQPESRDGHAVDAKISDAWRAFYTIIQDEREQDRQRNESELNFLLVYAGLFSAVVTPFLILIYPFGPDEAAATSNYLHHISQQLESFRVSTGFINSTTQASPTVEDVENVNIVGVLWTLSLLWGITAALHCIAILWYRSALGFYWAYDPTSPRKKLERLLALTPERQDLMVTSAQWPRVFLVISIFTFITGLLILLSPQSDFVILQLLALELNLPLVRGEHSSISLKLLNRLQENDDLFNGANENGIDESDAAAVGSYASASSIPEHAMERIDVQNEVLSTPELVPEVYSDEGNSKEKGFRSRGDSRVGLLADRALSFNHSDGFPDIDVENRRADEVDSQVAA